MDLLKNLDNMITASEFLDKGNFNNTTDMMIEFAKLHVEAALKEASENFKMKIKDDVYELDMNDDWMEVDKNSILNAYPLENIR